MSGKTMPGPNDAEYRRLVKELPPRPIRSEKGLGDVEERINGLLALPERSPAQEDYLDLLSHLVRIWEDEHVEIPPLSGVELVRELCKERGIPQRALVPIFGTASVVSEVLAGKRELQRKHIDGLAQFFQVPPGAFSRPRGRTSDPRTADSSEEESVPGATDSSSLRSSE
jgi:HTH-type transcriptional regulator/antitoxin HigA